MKQLIMMVSHINGDSSFGFAALSLRVPIGLILMAHGAQKLFAMFGGYGLEGTGQWMETLGLTPGYLMALMAGSAEFFGGMMIVLGLLTRVSALLITITMLVAIFAVHINNGLFISSNGYEYALALLAVSVSLGFSGAGRYSLDALINKRLAG